MLKITAIITILKSDEFIVYGRKNDTLVSHARVYNNKAIEIFIKTKDALNKAYGAGE